MSSPLTGDFEAVLQVSGATINRLVSTIHQNGGARTTLPTFTHGTTIRVGDPNPVDGMRGTVEMQVGVPRIELIHGVTDRFWLEVGVRARYRGDAGSTPVPQFIHGSVRAQYRLDPIDPACWGWQKLAGEYLWIRVIADTVTFTGTAEDDAIGSIALGMAPAVADARITRLARVMLKTRFEATPHKVSRRFRRGAMRSLRVGANRSVVAMPIGLTMDPPVGSIESISQDILEGRDFGIAIDGDVIIGAIQRQLDAAKASFIERIRFYHRTYIDLGFLGDVDVVTITIDWTIRLTSAKAQWIGGIAPLPGVNINGGLIAITASGEARTEKPQFNWSFDVTQLLVLSYDGSTEQFAITAIGSADVKVHGTFAGVIEPAAKPQIQAKVGAAIQAVAGGVAGQLSLHARKQELITQLKTIDDQADAWLDEAVFTPDGVIVRGHIAVSPRRPPVHRFERTIEQDGFSAFESWIPAGRVDAFGCSWTWFNNGGEPGSDTREDRYVLRRPPAQGRGKFGVMVGLNRPLPGLDGMGRICLVVRGVQVHGVTGEFVPVSTVRKCTRFGFDIALASPHRVFLREWSPGPRDPLGPVAEVAVHEVGGRLRGGAAANTLLVRVGDRWSPDIGRSLREGLAGSHRRDAGLVVLVLFNDGTLMRAGPDVMAEFTALAAELEAPLVVNEDVRGSWATALSMNREGVTDGALEWRLISPTGGVTWAHSGPADPRELTSAMDNYLFGSTLPDPVLVMAGLAPGTRLTTLALDRGFIEQMIEMENPCPPPPLGRFGVESAVTFVARNSAASEAAIGALARARGGREAETFVAIIFDGVQPEEVDDLRRSLPDGVVPIPDPDGAIARRFGVRVWPSTVRVNEGGLITGYEMGLDREPEPVSGSEDAS